MITEYFEVGRYAQWASIPSDIRRLARPECPDIHWGAPWDEVFPVPVSEIEAILHIPVGAASHRCVDPDAVRSWLRVRPFGPPLANRTGSLGLGVLESHLYRGPRTVFPFGPAEASRIQEAPGRCHCGGC